MPSGLELYRADGSLLLGVTTYVGMFEGAFATNGAATGSITDPKMIGRTLLTFLPDTGGNGAFRGPTVTLNAVTGQISWSYSFVASGGVAVPSIPNDLIYYGGY